MQQRRTTPLRPAQPPLTPTVPLPTDNYAQVAALKAAPARISALESEVYDLKNILRKERRNAARLQFALTRYNELLESTITSQREAFQQLHGELVPNPLKRGK